MYFLSIVLRIYVYTISSFVNFYEGKWTLISFLRYLTIVDEIREHFFKLNVIVYREDSFFFLSGHPSKILTRPVQLHFDDQIESVNSTTLPKSTNIIMMYCYY